MELQPAGQRVSGRKRNIRIVFGLFIGLLIIFTLFSNTLMSLTLPKVAMITPVRGELTHTFQGSGTVKWRAEAVLTGTAGAKVLKVNVKEGELAKKGQPLIIYDQKAAEQQLLDEQASLSKLNLSIEEQKRSFIEATQSGEEQRIEQAKHALKISAIDLDVQQRRIQKLKDDLAANRQLLAPFDGVVIQVNAIEGLDSTGGTEIMLSNSSLGFVVEFLAPADRLAELELGSKLNIQLTGSNARQIEGQLVGIQDMNDMNQGGIGEKGGGGSTANAVMQRLIVAVQDEELQAGERAELALTKKTPDVILVPTKAIHEEGDKKYVFGVEERNGPLGNAFYVRKIDVMVVDTNENQSAVTQGLFDQEQIIIESSEPLQEGNKVRM
ncbi:efflux RND transporter periplasmic adaptor subunit [Paenibacillaceae bacterium]|nr:efflux RND transporter periplasmic adaptor subunit [Paenibacillaceae bacterium]